MTTGHGDPRSWRVTAAAVLATGFALVMIAVAAGVLYELFAGAGAIGHAHLDDIAARGALALAVLLLAGAGSLAGGALSLAREGRGALLVRPLTVLFAIGCVGEIADVSGTAGTASTLIGAAVLVVVLVPVLLIAAERRAAHARRPVEQRR